MSNNITPNPLEKYFRVPGFDISLPTNGAFLRNPLQTNMLGQISVYPMTGADELLMKSPDALASGFAIESVLLSCVPAITNPRMVSIPDLDVILLAIRAATYGTEMTVEMTCPECGEVGDYEYNVPEFLSKIIPIPEDISVRLSDQIVVYLRPYNLKNTTVLSQATFIETRKIQQYLDADEYTQERVKSEGFRNLTKIKTIETADCITKVVTPDGEVSDPKSIVEFIQKIPAPMVTKIDDKLKELNQSGLDKNHSVTCNKCKHEWETTIEPNPSTFFARNS